MMRIFRLALAGLLVGQFLFAQSGTEPKQFRDHLAAAKAMLAQAPPNLLSCGDTGWQLDKAREHCHAALVLLPENSDALSTMGAILYRRGMYTSGSERDRLFDQSMGFYRRAIKANSENADAHEGIAELLHVSLMERIDKTLTQAGMWMGRQRPLGTDDISEQVRLDYREEIDVAARHAHLKLATDPKAVSALAILGNLARLRAYLANSQDEFANGMREVDMWYRKASSIPREPPTLRPCDAGAVVGSLPSPAP